jgi:hypothetical protein
MVFFVSFLLYIGTLVDRLWNVCSFTVLTLLDIIIPKLDVGRFADENTFLEQDVEPLSDDILIPKLDDEPLDDDCMLQKIAVDFLLMTSCFCNKMTTPLLMTTSFWNYILTS